MSTGVDLNRIAVFVQVVDSRGFTAAARVLGLPKSSVSRSVSRLEEELGAQLLTRTTRQLSLTDAGRAYYDRVREIVSVVAEARATVAELGSDPRGIIRATAPPDPLIADVFAAFARKYPLIHVELSLTGRTVDLVAEGFDLAVRAGRLRDSSLVVRKIAQTEVGIYASPEHIAQHGKPKDFAALAGHPWVLHRGRNGKSTCRMLGPRGEETIEIAGPLSADDLVFVHRAVLAGAGVGALPTMMCDALVATGQLVRLCPDHALREGAFYVVTPASRYTPARVALLRDFLVENLRKPSWGPPCPPPRKRQ